MIHYVTKHQPVGGQAACGIWVMEHRFQRVSFLKREITCARCRKLLGLKPKSHKRHSGTA